MSRELDLKQIELFANEFGVSPELMHQFVDFVLTSSNSNNSEETTIAPERTRNEVVEQLCADPYVYVDCAGVFKPGGYKHMDEKGVKPSYVPQDDRSSSYTPYEHIRGFGSAYQTAERYGLINSSHEADEFKSPVLHISDNGHSLWFLVFNDRTHDERGNVYTTFSAWLNPDLAEQYDPLINQDPTILVDLFRNKYPDCDQSEGRLEIIAQPLHLEPVGKLGDQLRPIAV